jgi:hypothetical protein
MSKRNSFPMKKTLLPAILACALVTSAVTASAQSQCSNLDFEDSTFVNWTGATGDNTGGLTIPIVWATGFISNGNNASSTDLLARHTIITVNKVDSIVTDPVTMQPDTQFTTLAPNGGVASVRLGNRTSNYESAKLTTQYAVTAQNSWFQFQFASIMEDPQHTWDMQPYFMINVYDQTMTIVPSLCDTIWAGDPSVPYIISGSNSMHLYRRWTPLSIDMSAYIGTTMTIEFINADCAFSGHFGYTYLDVSCFGTGVPNVWPGDADYNLQANNMDVLTLGVAYGATGTARAGATTSWQAEPSADWSQSVPLGANYKHADTNGDGIVDINDTLAISLNYSQTHTFRMQGPGHSVDPLTSPALYLDVLNDTVAPGGIITADIYLGSSSVPVNSLYGISFSLGYDNSLVQPGTVNTTFTGSMVGIKNNTMLGFAHDNFSAGRNDVTMCRNTHTEVDGYGYIGTIELTAATVTNVSTLNLTLGNVKAINGQMVNIPVATMGAPVVIDPAASVPVIPGPAHVALYPNPANGSVVVSTMADQVIEITNTLGQVIYTTTATGTATTVDLTNFEAGVYFVNVFTGTSKVTERLIVE